MDLVAGLHWLRENIPAFNGDPNRITLMGHGTGAALSNFIAVSPVAKGRFINMYGNNNNKKKWIYILVENISSLKFHPLYLQNVIKESSERNENIYVPYMLSNIMFYLIC